MAKYYLELVGKIKRTVLDCLFPAVQPPKDLKIHETLFCAVCRARLPENKKICHKNSPLILGAATTYENEEIRKAIWRLKYRGKTGFSNLLAGIMAIYCKQLGLDLKKYVIVPVPLSKQRHRQRGFNQSLLIAESLAKKIGLPLVTDALERHLHTAPQAEQKDWFDRKKNLIGAFIGGRTESIIGKNVILIDDVCTSGATLQEAAKALKIAGAKKILGLVAAKAGA